MRNITRTSADTDVPTPKQLGSPTDWENEDREDEALFDARMADLDAGSEMPLPAEIGDRVLQGDSLIIAICAWRGVTSTQLAEYAKLTQDDIARLESGQSMGEPAALRIAAALQVDPMWMVGIL